MPTLGIRITRIMYRHLSSGLVLTVHVVRVERLPWVTPPRNTSHGVAHLHGGQQCRLSLYRQWAAMQVEPLQTVGSYAGWASTGSGQLCRLSLYTQWAAMQVEPLQVVGSYAGWASTGSGQLCRLILYR